MALSQAAAPEGVWLAARGWCVQGRPSVTNWMPPALLYADWAQQLNTRLWEARMSHPFFCEVGQAPFLSMFLYSIHQQKTWRRSSNKWSSVTSVTRCPFFLKFNRYGLLVSQLLFSSSPIYMHPPNAIGVSARKKEESLSFEGFLS